MAKISENLRYLLEALRTPAANASTTMQSGPDAGQTREAPQGFGPIEQRRDGYRLYVAEKKANGENPVSYQEWFSTQTPQE